jgi:hypothetical protein
MRSLFGSIVLTLSYVRFVEGIRVADAAAAGPKQP